MNIFVGNLSSQATEKDLENLFSPFGEIRSVKIINDRYTGKSRGFGFVEMSDRSSGEKAVEKLNNSPLNGQSIVVNEARPQSSNDSFSRKRY